MKQPLIVILILLILGLGFGYMFVWPNYQRWNAKKSELKTITSELDELTAKQGFIKQLEGAEPTLGQMSGQALVFVPTDEEREQFASELDAMAQANSMTLTTLNFTAEAVSKTKASTSEDDGAATASAKPKAGASKTTGGAKALGFNASLTGSYASVERFLKLLDQTKRYSTVKSFEVTSSTPVTSTADPAVTAEPQINLEITGSIYTKPLTTKFAKDQKFSAKAWQYLIDRATAIQASSAKNPFASFQ